MTQKVALISGASRGIGAAVAGRLAADGWLLSLGMRAPDDAGGRFGGAHIARHDAMQKDEAEWVAAAQERFGRIDAVICCAGIMAPETVVSVDDETLDAMFEVNVKSPRRLVRAAWPALQRAGAGRVVILASLSGKRVKSAASGAYAMTKHAAVALSHGIRQAGWEDGIRATAICPGFVDTDMARAITDFAPADMTAPEDVARMVGLALDMPNTASLAEMGVNCTLEACF
jgi:NAD(P)-dependent dehydrogenase (short-subunit alcohol dehydrogenase family)